jgi:AcrR family transcriptional regulator
MLGAMSPTRRSGAALEAALLDAAWLELTTVGYARMTMATVAARARTSEPVLYRRWANKDELVMAALHHQRQANPIEPVDTGSLREDMIGQLTNLGNGLAGIYAIAAAASLSGLLANTGASPADIRRRVMDPGAGAVIRGVYDRAAARGELDLGRVPTSVLEMPFDLVRQELLLRMEPPSPKRIREIVDELFLPLVRAAGSPT